MAILVVIGHLGGVIIPVPGTYHAVDVFFTLSGLALCIGYGKWLPFPLSGFRLFLRNRLARVLPVAWLSVLLFWSVPLLAQAAGFRPDHPFDISPGNFFGNLLFLDANLPGFTSVGAKWSLSNEMAAYVFLFPFVWLLRRRWVAWAVLVAVITLQWIFFANWNELGSLFGRCIPCFLAGCALYHLRLSRLPGWLTAGTALAGLYIFWFKDIGPMALCSSLLVLSAWHAEGTGAKILQSRSFQWLGDVSYSLYMLHSLFLYPIGFLVKHSTLAREFYPWWSMVPVALALVLAHLVFQWFEKPLHLRFKAAPLLLPAK